MLYSTDNGPHMNTWPDAGMTPFRNEKNSNWEGAYRVPSLVRWPGRIPPGTVLNGIVSHADWFVTLLAAAGDTDVADRLTGRYRPGRYHLPGAPRRAQPARLLTGAEDASPRKHFFYVSDDGDLTALRYDNWKIVFLEQRAQGTLQVWAEPYTELRVPKIFNLRTDPYERADITSNTYYDWLLDHAWVLVPAQAYVARMLQTLREFPPRQEAASFTVAKMMEKLHAGRAEQLIDRRRWTQAKERRPWSPAAVRPGRPPSAIDLPGGLFTMGSDAHYPEESPTHRVRVDAFTIDAYPVTNRQFAAFVAATRYRPSPNGPSIPPTTRARRQRTCSQDRWSSPRPTGPVDLRHLSQWWTWTPGASWRHPEGPGSSIRRLPDHPVVHVAHEDAAAYAAWVGGVSADRG